ncbi:Hypothetical predicted protein, partial [Mytilus galloprovincialis]
MEVYGEDGTILTDDETILNKWKTEFQNIYNTDNAASNFDDEFYRQVSTHKSSLEDKMLDPLYNANQDRNTTITIENIRRLVYKTKNGKSCGIDSIPYEVLRYECLVIHSLFQLIFETGIIPSVWRQAILCPILKDKSSDPRVPLNYRGISLLSCISKLYSAFKNSRLSSYLESNDILADEQNGFRSDRSFSTSACVRVNNRLSQWFVCSSGVKQGDNLSPTLFSIFINDLVEEVNSLGLGVNIGDSTLSLLLYADDIVLLASSETDMQCMLDKVHEWCKRWRVLINTEKSKVMHFRPSRSKRSNFQFKIGDNLLQITDTYKYLGVTFHDLKDFKDNANRLSEAG